MTKVQQGPKEFKRLNFFTGFFTTADDWNAGETYHLEKRRLHNRGLHTPGVIRGGLRITAAPGLSVHVAPGAALDAGGNEIYLGVSANIGLDLSGFADGDTAYLAIRYQEQLSDYVHNVENEAYSGHTRIGEVPRLAFVAEAPDNQGAIELARVLIQGSPAAIASPADPASPGPNEVDTTHVQYAGAVIAAGVPRLSETDRQRLILAMIATRRAFADLETRFPTPSQADVRHAAIGIEMLARVDAVGPDQVISVMAAKAAAEQDVEQELSEAYSGLITTAEYRAFAVAVDALLAAIDAGAQMDALLVAQDAVAIAARELSELVLQKPRADAGDDARITAVASEGRVGLDGSRSEAFGGQHITHYIWSRLEGEQSPVAHAAADAQVTSMNGEARVMLDASASKAISGRSIVRYHWDKRD